MERVGGYCRVSSEKQVEKGTSLEDQQDLIEEYCKKNGYELFKLYVEKGIPGAVDPENRPESSRMIHDAKNGRFNIMCF